MSLFNAEVLVPSTQLKIPAAYGRCVDVSAARCCEFARDASEIMRTAQIQVAGEFAPTGLPVTSNRDATEFVSALRYRRGSETRAGIVLYQQEQGSLSHPIAGLLFVGPSPLNPSAPDDRAYLVKFRGVDARRQTVEPGYDIEALSDNNVGGAVKDPNYGIADRLRDAFSSFGF